MARRDNPIDEAGSRRRPRDAARKSGARRSLPALLVFVLTAAGLLASLFLVWSTIASERAQREQAQRTRDVITALSDIDRAAINAESGQRGYFITLDRRYLATYEFGRELYPQALARLRDKLDEGQEEARQMQLLSDIEIHADRKFAELAGNVALIARGQVRDAQQQIMTNEGRVAMERLRESLREMETIERGLLAEATGEATTSENRILPLLALTMLLTLGSLALGLSQTVRASHAEAQAAQAAELAAARDRADLLAHELNHRVKNLFAVILAIVRMSARDKPEAKPVTDGIASRIHALVDAHEATQGKSGDGSADFRDLIGKVLAPYLSDDNPATLSGPDLRLTPREATPLGLVLHELATNAAKYGAWASEDGRIAIGWKYIGKGDAREAAIEWREFVATPRAPSDREGFGSTLMESSARQLGGTIAREFVKDGVVVAIRFPHPG